MSNAHDPAAAALSNAEELRRFSALLELIYEGAVNVEAWNDVPKAICEWMNAPIGLLFTPLHTREQGGFMLAHNMGPLAQATWNAKYHGCDLWVHRALDSGRFFSGAVARDQDLATEEELMATEMYREWLAPQNIGRLLSTAVYGLEQARQPPVVCSLNRSMNQPFLPEDAERYRLITAHLSRALGVMFRLREADFKLATTLSALDHLQRAVILLDRQGRVFHVNRPAQEILDRKDGLGLSAWTNANGVAELVTDDARAQLLLEGVLRSVLSVQPSEVSLFSEVVRVPRKGHSQPYALQLSPLPAQNDFGRGSIAPAAIVFIDDEPAAYAFDDVVMLGRYGLTTTELRVLSTAMEGNSVADMAQELGVSVNTVKTHLKRLYEKTGAKSRSQLIKVAMASRMRPGCS